jgi:uncharacterized protein YbaR (Trm112 family)
VSAPAAGVEGLLDILVCPLTRTKLRYDDARQELVSDAAGIAFPIRNGVRFLRVEVARTIAP